MKTLKKMCGKAVTKTICGALNMLSYCSVGYV